MLNPLRRLPWIWLLAWVTTAQANPRLPVDYSIKRWVSSEQLPLTTVEAMTQTRDGFIWFAMNGGLGRFDGVTLEVFSSRNTPELAVPYVTALVEHPDGSLWLGTAGGGLVRYHQGRFVRFAAGQGLTNEQVKALAFDRAGRLWIGTDGGGVFVREPDGKFRSFGEDSGLNDRFVVAVKIDEKGRPVVLTFKHGCFVLEGSRFVHVEVAGPESPKGDFTLTQAGSGRVWLSSGTQVYVLTGDRFQPWERMAELRDIVPIMAWETATNEVWLATDRSLVHWKDGDWASYVTGGAASPRMVGSFLVDHEGSVWLSTEGGGLVQLRQTPAATMGAAEGLTGDEVTSVVAPRDGSLWVGTTHGLTRFDTSGSRHFQRADGLRDDFIFSLLEDAGGVIWVSTRRGGLQRWKDGVFTPVTAVTNLGKPVITWCLTPGANGTVWAGTQVGALQFQGDRLLRVVNAKDGLSNDDVRIILDEGDAGVWFGTSYGLNFLAEGRMKSFAVTPANEPIEVVVALHRDAEDALWIGTLARGLFRLHHDKFERFSTEDGLPGNSIHSISEDEDGNFWLGTGSGLAKVIKASFATHRLTSDVPLNVRVYRRADGLRSEEITGSIHPTVARTADGRMWFATADGLSTVRPGASRNRRRPPLTSLERVAVEGPWTVSGLYGKRSDALPVILEPTGDIGNAPAPAGQRRAVFTPHGLESLRIPPGQERLDFQFVSPSFVAPHAVTYRYRLQNFDRDWIDAGTRRAAYYTRVPPGHYIFEVEGCNELGRRSEPGASLAVIVEPAWWQLRLVQALGWGIVVGSGILFYQVRVQKLRRLREESAKFSRQLIRSQEKERARIAGELHDGLGQELQLIRNRAELARRRGEPDSEVERQLASISETAVRAINGMRALSRGLRPPELDQLGLTQALRWLGQNMADTFTGRLEFTVESVDGVLEPEQELDFYRVAQEALNNAVKHSEASEITFEVQWDKTGLLLSVFDNGLGFEAEKTSDQPHSGSGLKNMTERAAMLRGTLELQTEPNVGTRLTMQVPVSDNRRPAA